MGSQIISLTIVYLDADQRKRQSAVSLAFVQETNRWSVNSPRKGPVTRKMFPLGDVRMWSQPICAAQPQLDFMGDVVIPEKLKERRLNYDMGFAFKPMKYYIHSHLLFHGHWSFKSE